VVVVLRIASGHSADYLLNAVAAGRENYYTGAVAEGEPPGRWYGTGATELGLAGLVDAQDMRALFEHFVDPSDPAFRDPDSWAEAAKLGHAGRQFMSAERIYARALDAEPHADAERREALRVEASKAERNNVAFLDATFSVQKSVTVLHTAFEAQQVAAENAGRVEEAAQWGAHRQAVGTRSGRGTGRCSITSPRTPATPGWGITAGTRGGSSTPTTGPSLRSSSTIPGITTRSCTSTTRC
jgi:hypothetical protein